MLVLLFADSIVGLLDVIGNPGGLHGGCIPRGLWKMRNEEENMRIFFSHTHEWREKMGRSLVWVCIEIGAAGCHLNDWRAIQMQLL